MTENNLLGQQIQGYTISKKLGSGGYGTVYLGVKEDLGKQYQTAIKHISMPDAEGYESVLQDYGYDKAATQAHFEKLVAGITSEINTLLNLSKKDNRYIVAYYDHDIQKSIDPLRFEIFMRMEYLTPLNRHIRQKGMTVGEAIKLGLNMCDALALCHNNDIMHRDIKEANIFVSDTGNYKLGDFGVAKVALETTQAGSIKGTASYMAPEIYLREPYDKSVDIYSLGIVLYKLLNNQRLPFMPEAPTVFTSDDKNNAEARRLKGETPPLPSKAKNRLGEIIVKACSAKTERYATAEELKRDLSAFIGTLSEEEYDTVIIPQAADGGESVGSYSENSINSYTQTQGGTMTMGASNSGQNKPTPTEKQNPYAGKKPKSKKKKVIALVSIFGTVAIAGAIALYLFISNATDPVNKFTTAVESGDFVSAAQLYRDELKYGNSDKRVKAEKFVVNHAETVKDAYINATLEYEDALTQLQELGKLGIVADSELKPLVSEVNEMRTSRSAYEEASRDIDARDYQSAISKYRKVIPEDSNYADAQTELANAVRSYKDEVIGALSGFDIDNRYNDAISSLKVGLLVVPDDADFLAKMADYEKQIDDNLKLTIGNIIQQANNSVGNADYLSALNDLKAAVKVYPNSDDIKNTIADVENSYINFVFEEADAHVTKKEFNEAVDLLTNMQGQVSDKNVVLDKIAEVNALRPIDLSQLVVIDSDNYKYTSGLYTDSFGYNYDGYHLFDAYRSAYAVFNLDGQYSNFSGTIVSGTGTSSNAVSKTSIYCDNKLVFTSTDFTKRSEAVKFNLDVRGVTKLQISIENNDNTNHLSIVNTQLSK